MKSQYSISLQSYISPSNSENQQQIIDNYLQISPTPPKTNNNHANIALASSIHANNPKGLQYVLKIQPNTILPSSRNLNDRNRRSYKCLSNQQLKQLQEQFKRGVSDKNFLCEKYGVSQTSILRFLRFYRQNGHLPQRTRRDSFTLQDEYTQNQYPYQVQPFTQNTAQSRKFTASTQINRARQQPEDNPYQEDDD